MDWHRLFCSSAALAIGVATPTASAVEFSIIGPDYIVYQQPFDEFTINIALTNDSGSTAQIVDAYLYGLNAVDAVVTSGETASHHFVGICASNLGGCLGGINSVDNAFFNQGDLSDGIYQSGDDSVDIIKAIKLGTTTQSGVLDPGLDGGLFVASARDVSITLVSGFPVGVLMIGGSYFDGMNQIPIAPVPFFLLTPEPGTAVLIGFGLLGLAGLAKRGERIGVT